RSAVHAPHVPGGAHGREGPAALPVSQRLVRPANRARTRRAAPACAPAGAARGPRRHGLRHGSRGGPAMNRRPRSQRMTIVNGILLLVVLVVVLQLWLLTATMNGYLAGDTAIVLPAALAS